ncbi:MAG: flagellar hook-length control protein FliK [Planctomycetes bacterium]|nr:flagellar hook-length control protein FliK [Planctomycetota bacterium]
MPLISPQRFVDVKARPDRSSAAKADSEPARFPDPLAGQQEVAKTTAGDGPVETAEATEPQPATQPESKSSDSTEDANPEEIAAGQASKKPAQEGSQQTKESGGALITDAQPAVETTPVAVEGIGTAAAEAKPEMPLPQTESKVQGEPVKPLDSAPIQGTPVDLMAQAPSGTGAQVAPDVQTAQAAPQTTAAKVEVSKTPEFSETNKAEAPSTQQAPAQAQNPSDANHSGNFADGPADPAPLEALPQTEPVEKPSIEAAIKDARIESIAMNSRPNAPAAPVQVTPSPMAAAFAPQTTPAATGEAILTQINARIQPGMNRAILHLSPESLGRISIAVSVDAGEVRADMRVESADSMQAIQKYVPELKALFAQADMELSELNLQLDSGNSGFDWEQEAPEQQQNWAARTASRKNQTHAPDGAQPTLHTPLIGGLDLIA